MNCVSRVVSLKVAKARLDESVPWKVWMVLDALTPILKDQIGIVFATKEAPAVAKVLHDFSKDNEAFKHCCVVILISKILDARMRLIRIASLPSREVLLGATMWYIKCAN